MADSTDESRLESVAVKRPTHASWAGRELWSTLAFLSLPTMVVGFAVILDVPIQRHVLYGVAAIVASMIAIRSLRDPEWILATLILYMPFSKEIVVSITKGVNAMALLLLGCVVSWVVCSKRAQKPVFYPYPLSKPVLAFFFLSSISFLTLVLQPGGLSYLLDDVLQEGKGWIDQFMAFFVILHLIRDGAMARRLVVYAMLGTVLVSAMGVQELIDSVGKSSIESSRLLGPQLQANDFGAFLTYGFVPFLAFAALRIRDIRSWVMWPYLLICLKLVLATFSRGAYVGIALASAAVGYHRGKLFFLGTIVLGVGLLAAVPELIPSSLQDRLSSLTNSSGVYKEAPLDKSAQARLTLWSAGLKMIEEDPLFGKGFKMFPVLKGYYTETNVRESDPHNMFIGIAAEMGLLALGAFIVFLYRLYRLSLLVYRKLPDTCGRMIGLAGAALVPAILAINMFGSRMIHLETSGYVWVIAAVVGRLAFECQRKDDPGE